MKKLLAICIAAIVLAAASCSVRGSNSLVSEAITNHGLCTVVHEDVAEDGSRMITLRDTAQDFTYTVRSGMSSLDIDGSSFGEYEHTSDSFDEDLYKFVLSEARPKIDAFLSTRKAFFSSYNSYIRDNLGELLISKEDASNAEEISKGIAEILQGYNYNNRLDKYQITVNQENSYGKAEKIGSIKLPDIRLRTIEEDNIDYFLEMARAYTDIDAEFVRTEKATFEDFGLDINKLPHILGSEDDMPKDDSSPVVKYYFRGKDGQEYYLCDFQYHVDGSCHPTQWYTNYDYAKYPYGRGH